MSDIGFQNLDKSVETHQSNWKESVSKTYDKASLNKDWTQELFETAHEAGIAFFTSPYSESLVDYVEPFVDAYKIGSGDITYSEIIKKISKKGKPVLIASGAANMNEVSEAMSILQNTSDICLMQCNTNYEGLLESAKFQNLNVLNSFKESFPKAILGLSCHMPKWTSVLGAVTLGARIIEKHFTDDRTREGPDHGFAINPKEWEDMVNETRLLESMLGNGEKVVENNEQKTVIVQQRSLRAKSNMKKGQIVELEMLEALRPCPKNAIKPNRLNEVIGKTLLRDINVGDCINNEDIE